jgi:hypothetical protein
MSACFKRMRSKLCGGEPNSIILCDSTDVHARADSCTLSFVATVLSVCCWVDDVMPIRRVRCVRALLCPRAVAFPK